MALIMENRKISTYYFVLLIIGSFVTSCVSPKKIVYFQGDDKVISIDSISKYSTKYAPNDLLNIIVSGIDAEVVGPFNDPLKGEKGMGYRVDGNGMINFPILGQLKVGGLTRIEVVEMLRERLKEYIVDPVVDVDLLNFKVIVLGAVNSPGAYTFSGEKVTLMDAIGVAGDLQIIGLRENILVIRENDDKREEYRVDITSKEVFKSPAYILHTNDIIYVEPNKGGVKASVYNNTAYFRANLGILSSLISTIVTLLVLISINKK